MSARSEAPGPSGAATAAGKVAIVAIRRGKASESTSLDNLPRLLRDEEAILWIDLASPSPDDVGVVAKALGLHPLIVEDIV